MQIPHDAKQLIPVVIAFVVIGVAFIPLFDGTYADQLSEYYESCDEQFGEDGWVLVPANLSERGFHIGDIKVCVDEDSERAQWVG